eukprot:g892.t1
MGYEPDNAGLWLATWTRDQSKFDALWHSADTARRRELAMATNEHGWAALHFACVSGQQSMLRPLLEDVGGSAAAQEQVRTPTEQGWFPLHYASGFGHAAAIDALLAAGADLEVGNERSATCRGWTPWHRAVRWWLSPGKPNAIAHLLAKGVRADAQAADGKTAAELANPEVHRALEQMLRAEATSAGAGGGAAGRGNGSAQAALDDLLQVRSLWRAAQQAEQQQAAAAPAETSATASGGDGDGNRGDGGGGDDDCAQEALAALEARVAALDAEEADVVANPAKHGLSSRADCMAREADIVLEREKESYRYCNFHGTDDTVVPYRFGPGGNRTWGDALDTKAWLDTHGARNDLVPIPALELDMATCPTKL